MNRIKAAGVVIALVALTTVPAKAAPVFPVTYTAQGPGPMTNGQVENIAGGDPVVGAVHTVVAHPTNADQLWIGTTNGGVWRTNNATAASPTWQPLTDEHASLSIGALQMDPTIGTNLVLVAGFGNYSSFGRTGGARAGLIRTTNGGNSWTPIGTTDLSGQNISGVAPRGATIVASSNNGGVWRSTNTGATFIRVINNSAFDLASDPGNAQRLYAATTGGLFRSDDTGATWTNVSGAGAGTPGGTIGGTTNNIEMSVGSGGVVFAGVVNNGQLAGLFRSADQGGTWTQLDTPQTIEGGTPIGLQPRPKPGSQGSIHFSILAHRTNANLVFLGGDRQPLGAGPDGVSGTDDDNFPNSIGAQDFSGRLFRCDASLAAGAQCAHFTHGNANGSSPHADSREMTWDANGDIVETDDGGVYRQIDPATNGGRWVSVNGNLQVAESHSCDYDSVSNIIMCGNQDTGVPEQNSPGSIAWREVTTADGGTVAIDDNGASSVRYYSNQFFGGFSRRTCNAANTCSSTGVPLIVAGSGGQNLFQFDPAIQFYGPIEVNAVATNRLVLGTNRLYESADQGSNITDLTGNTGSNITEAIAYGGRSSGIDNPDVLYYGNSTGLFVRTSAGGAFAELTEYPGGVPTDIVLDTDDWLTAYVIDGSSVYRTDDAGTTWFDITGDLFDDFNPGTLLSIAFIPSTGFDGIVVGSTRGVFATQTRALGRWAEFGSGIPNTHAFDVRYDDTDDVLLAGTLGRGAWLIANASNAFPTADLRVSKSDTPDPVIAGEELFYTVTVSNDGPSTAFGVVLSDDLPDQITFLSGTGDCSPNLGDATCDLGDIPSGQSRSVTLKTRVNADAVAFDSDGTIRVDNRATVSTASVDPDPADDSVVTSTFVQERADLAVTKLCVPNTNVPAGQTAKCTVYVDSYGPSYARAVTVTDDHTGNGSFTIVSATPTIGSCSISGGQVNCNLGVMAAASPTQTGRESVEILITANEAMSIDDIAKAVAATPDPIVANNQREDTLSFSASADVELSKSGPAVAVAGTPINYVLTVTNDGPSAAAGVFVEDTLPSAVELVSVTGSGGASCVTEPKPKCSFGTLAAGATRTMTVTVKIKPDFLGPMTDNAKAFSTTFDPDLADNLASLTTNVVADADLAVTIADTPDPVIAGDALSYQINAVNNGPSKALDVKLTIPLPATLTFTSSVGTCALQTNTNTVVCPLGDLDPAQQASVTIHTMVASSVPSGAVISTTATIGSPTPDSLPGNNSATAQTSVVTSADLAISLTSDRSHYGLLSTIHYTITVTNNGLSDARNVTVTQQMPEHHKAAYKSNDAGCPPPDVNGLFTCNIGTVPTGQTKTFHLDLKVKTILCTIEQTARVTSDEPDPYLANNSDTRVVTVILL